MNNNFISIIKTASNYKREKEIYKAVEKGFEDLGLDKKNPFKDLIKIGDKVVIKPNLVLHFNSCGFNVNSVITQAVVIKPIVDAVIKAGGKIIIADAPQMNADFEEIIRKNGLKEMIDSYKKNGISIELLDLRRERTIYKTGVIWKRVKLKGDPLGYTEIDLKEKSEMVGIDPCKLYGADYNRKETELAHSNGHHKYYVANTILNADVLISVPKMKVHRKAGVTLNLKNMVGVNGNKNNIIHYEVGRDEYSKSDFISKCDRWLKDLLLSKKRWSVGKYIYAPWTLIYGLLRNKDVELGGDWYGNNTIWKSVLDLNRIIMYANKEGKVKKKIQRKYFSVVDGIIGGEGEGPLGPTPKKCGIIAMGFNPVLVDYFMTKAMGFDPERIPLIREAMKRKYLVKERGMLISNDDINLKMRPSSGWKGHIELK